MFGNVETGKRVRGIISKDRTTELWNLPPSLAALTKRSRLILETFILSRQG